MFFQRLARPIHLGGITVHWQSVPSPANYEVDNQATSAAPPQELTETLPDDGFGRALEGSQQAEEISSDSQQEENSPRSTDGSLVPQTAPLGLGQENQELREKIRELGGCLLHRIKEVSKEVLLT